MKKSRFHSLRFTLTSVVALLILFSVFLSAILSYHHYANDFQKYSSQQIEQTLEQLSINLNTYVDELFRLTTYIYYDEAVVSAMEASGGTELDSLQRHRIIESYLDKIMIMPRKDILNVFVITDAIYYSGRFPKSIDYQTAYQEFDWYRQAMTGQTPVFVPPHKEQLITYPKNTVFSIVKQLRSVQSIDKVIGVIKVDASYNGITDIAEKINLGQEGGLFIIDDAKNIIYSSTSLIKSDFLSEIPANPDSSWVETIDSCKYMIHTKQVENSGWTIVAVNSLHELTQGARQTRLITVLVATLSSLFAIFVLLIFTHRFLKPLQDIVQLMKEVQTGNFEVAFTSNRNDEIGYLGNSFNKMVKTLHDNIEKNTELATKVYEFEILHKEAKFQALQSQIKPHFLYNTLNMISMQIQVNQLDSAVENIENLHYLLRTMAKQTKETTVEDEFAILDAYLKIQSSRFGQRLSYELKLEESLKKLTIPSFILQPLVENAVVHGCEAQRQNTTIIIEGTCKDNICCFVVSDNGKGIPENQLNMLREKLSEAPHNPSTDILSKSDGHIGLENVNKRIKLRYGNQYGIKVQSQYGVYTQFIIELPLLKGVSESCIR